MRLLFDHNADELVRDNIGTTALHFAAIGGHPDIARILLERGAEVSTENRLEFTLPSASYVRNSSSVLDHNTDEHAHYRGMTSLQPTVTTRLLDYFSSAKRGSMREIVMDSPHLFSHRQTEGFIFCTYCWTTMRIACPRPRRKDSTA